MPGPAVDGVGRTAMLRGAIGRGIALLIALAIAGTPAAAQRAGTPAATARPSRSKVSCRVDPAVELLSVIQTLARDTMARPVDAPSQLDYAYRREVRAWFAPHRDHAAVTTAARLIDAGANHVAASIGSALTAPPALRERRPWPRVIGEGPDAIGRDSLRALLDRARDFAARSQFARFFAEHQPLYARLCGDILAGGELAAAADAVTRFYAVRPRAYEVVLMPLVPFLGVAAPGTRVGPGSSLSAFVGPAHVAGDAPRFRAGWELTRVLIHEFSHPHVNALVSESAPSLARSAVLFPPTRGRLWRANRVASWSGAVDETVVRAAVAVMRGDAAGDSAMHTELGVHRVLGFVFVDSVAAELRAARARGEWPFAAAGPRLVRLFDRLARSPDRNTLVDLPFEGGMVTALRGREADSLLFIVPTGEQNRVLQDSLHAHVRARAARYRQSAVLTDGEALGRDLSAHTLWAVGTLGGNAWLRAHSDRVPVRIDADRIEADSAVLGERLVFVSAVPNPANPRRALLLTVGQRLEELTHGWWLLADDYAVVDGRQVLARGTYVKDGTRWRFAGRARAADREPAALP